MSVYPTLTKGAIMENLPDWRLHDLAKLTGKPLENVIPKREKAVRKAAPERAIKDEE